MSEMTNTLQGRVNVAEKKIGEFENSSTKNERALLKKGGP